MARYTLIYGLRLVPEGSVTKSGVTLHTLDGTIPQLRRSLDRSLDAFFDILPGADEEDLETFGD
jgi:hypothetical protein